MEIIIVFNIIFGGIFSFICAMLLILSKNIWFGTYFIGQIFFGIFNYFYYYRNINKNKVERKTYIPFYFPIEFNIIMFIILFFSNLSKLHEKITDKLSKIIFEEKEQELSEPETYRK